MASTIAGESEGAYPLIVSVWCTKAMSTWPYCGARRGGQSLAFHPERGTIAGCEDCACATEPIESRLAAAITPPLAALRMAVRAWSAAVAVPVEFTKWMRRPGAGRESRYCR